MEGGVRAAVHYVGSAGSAGSGGSAGSAGSADEFKTVQIRCAGQRKRARRRSRVMFCLTFLGTSRANRLLLRPFLDEWLPEMVSKPMDSRETSLKKSKKTSGDSSGGNLRLWTSGSAPRELSLERALSRESSL